MQTDQLASWRIDCEVNHPPMPSSIRMNMFHDEGHNDKNTIDTAEAMRVTDNMIKLRNIASLGHLERYW